MGGADVVGEVVLDGDTVGVLEEDIELVERVATAASN